MSSETPGVRSLAAYIEAIFSALDEHDPAVGQRIRSLASSRTARIRLDDEVVLASFVEDRLRVQPDDVTVVADGYGATGRDTVVDILTGRLEAVVAVLTGRIEIIGKPDAVAAMLQVIETILDAAARAPALQLLERELVESHPVATVSTRPDPAWYPRDIRADELTMLARLDLVRDDADH